MRAYFFGNMYLSSIQQGIQAGHVVAEMFAKYVSPEGCSQLFMLMDWANEHKTMVLLNAGYSDEIRLLIDLFRQRHNPFPWAHFHEGQDSLDGALTSVGIILPEEIYNAAKSLRSPPAGALVKDFIDGTYDPWNGYKHSDWDAVMADKLNTYGLAR